MRKSENLRERLDAFKLVMLSKFFTVERKHPKDSVTDDSIDWRDFNWQAIEEHFWDEIEELKLNPRSSDELVDIANMAFLLWWHYNMSEEVA